MSLRPVPAADLVLDERDLVGVDVTLDGVVVGYGYVLGDVVPTLEQHVALLNLARQMGRMLTDAEVVSVVRADGGDDANH